MLRTGCCHFDTSCAQYEPKSTSAWACVASWHERTPPSECPPTIHSRTAGARVVNEPSGRRSKKARLSHGLVMTTVTFLSVTSPESFEAYAHGATLAPGMKTSPTWDRP